MGGGSWSAASYSSMRASNMAAGVSDFDYSDRVTSGAAPAVVNAVLDPSMKAGDASPFKGKVMREVCISTEHPNPTAIAIGLDVTGSNIAAARLAHSKLPQLLGVLQRAGGIEDPQILFGFIGDAHSDTIPLQIGQFESDNRLDETLEAAVLEGGGGGSMSESYELFAYFMAKHTYLEPFEKEGRKGYLFFIGDEKPYLTITNEQGGYRGHTLESLIGDKLEKDLSTAELFEELKQRYEVFFLFQRQGAYAPEQVVPTWRTLIGENAVVLDDPNTICEFIAGLLAMREGDLDEEEMAAELTGAGFDPVAVAAVSGAVAKVAGSGTGGTVAKTEGSLDLGSDEGGTDRL